MGWGFRGGGHIKVSNRESSYPWVFWGFLFVCLLFFYLLSSPGLCLCIESPGEEILLSLPNDPWPSLLIFPRRKLTKRLFALHAGRDQ